MANETHSSMSPESAARFKYWQTRTIIATMAGYALFYFVRKNLSMAMPGMQEDLGITKADLGIFLTLHGVLYGVSKFANGVIGDRVNARIFMVFGLVMCSLCNLVFGLSSIVLVFGIMWVLNGWFQGMGFPPCARLLTHWIPPGQLATKMSAWNTSHSIGAALALIICGYVAGSLGWRWCFYAPSAMTLAGAFFLWFALRDTPTSVGLPEITSGKDLETVKKEENTKEFRLTLRKRVFGNPFIWILAIANFFVYVVRFAILDWGPTLLGEWKNVDIAHAGWMIAGFEILGIIGMLVAGWATDRFFGGRGARVCLICMAFASLFMFLFWELSFMPVWGLAVLLMLAGFFIYGPQALVGIAVSNLATKKAAATAVGFTGLFAYASTMITGWGFGMLADSYGWSFTFAAILASGVIGTAIFALAWKSKADGYDE